MEQQHIKRFQSEEILKILGDPIRASILRMLIAKPATISQIGEVLQKHPAQIRHHIKQMEKIGVVNLESVHKVQNYQEKYYQATAQAFFINLSFFPTPPPEGQVVILGSDDLALNLLKETCGQIENLPKILTIPVGSLDGLIYLRENYCQISGCHLLDLTSGDYNINFVKNLFSDQKMLLVTLTHRKQGLFVLKGNPIKIKSLKDLTRKEVRFVNRNRGAGTRLWLDQSLREHKISPSQISGYDLEVNTHQEVINTILTGEADTGVAIFAAGNNSGLDFIPIFEERYDLVMSLDFFNSTAFQTVWSVICSKKYQNMVNQLGGYNTSHTGDVIRI